MIRREQRHKYSQPAAEDRASWIDRALWSREDHPLLEKLMLAVIAICAAIEIPYQIYVHMARAAAVVAHTPGI